MLTNKKKRRRPGGDLGTWVVFQNVKVLMRISGFAGAVQSYGVKVQKLGKHNIAATDN